MRLYTSYFAKYKGPNALAVTRWEPNWWAGGTFTEIAPTAEILQALKRGDISFPIFRDLYLKELEAMKAEVLCKCIPEDTVMLCYEKDPNQCHRSVLAEYLNARGYDVREL